MSKLCCNNCGAPLKKSLVRQFMQCEYCMAGLFVAGTRDCRYTLLLDHLDDLTSALGQRSRKLKKNRGKEPIIGAVVAGIYTFIVSCVSFINGAPVIQKAPSLIWLVFGVVAIAFVSLIFASLASLLGYLAGLVMAMVVDPLRPAGCRRVDWATFRD